MSQAILLIQTVLSVLKLVPQIVDTLEVLFPAGGQGAAKLEQAKTIVQTALSVTADATPLFESVWAITQPAIAAVVASRKATQ